MGRTAVFLDRDGVINNHGGYINSAEDFSLLPGVAAAIRRLNDAGIPVIVVTNQGGVAFGHLTEDELAGIHAKMERELAQEHARVDAIYACPYHPRGTVAGLNRESRCRKPQPGMLERAGEEHGIDLTRSYMVGDMTVDIAAGAEAGCTTILVQTGIAGSDGKIDVSPDAIVADLPAAVDWILAPAARSRSTESRDCSSESGTRSPCREA